MFKSLLKTCLNPNLVVVVVAVMYIMLYLNYTSIFLMYISGILSLYKIIGAVRYSQVRYSEGSLI